MVQKHWRQDWRYAPEFVPQFRGNQRWERLTLSRAERKGLWAQDVYQVDDTPRYSSVGAWEHTPAASIWTGASTWRPLPRREFTVRDDYNVLVGANRATVLSSGWVHEQDNLKLLVDEHGRTREDSPYLARELGIDRYERIKDYDFSAGDAYWQTTQPFWRVVRAAWTRALRTNPSLRIAEDCRGKPAFELTFDYAQRLQAGEAATPTDYERVANEVLNCTVGQ